MEIVVCPRFPSLISADFWPPISGHQMNPPSGKHILVDRVISRTPPLSTIDGVEYLTNYPESTLSQTLMHQRGDP